VRAVKQKPSSTSQNVCPQPLGQFIHGMHIASELLYQSCHATFCMKMT
jgi:hypothetical protein